MIDTHAHITSDELYFVVDEIIKRAKVSGLKKIFNIATDEKTLERGIELEKRHPIVSNIAATTPHDVDKEGESFFKVVAAAAHEKKLIGIGETGLDYFYKHSDVSNQQHYLRKYIELAERFKLPIVIHCRDAFEDLFKIFDEMKSTVSVVLHCFTGTTSEALECVKRGWMVSFSGILTYKKSEDLRTTFLEVPLNHIFVETDSPYLAPQSLRGKRNEPAYIEETIRMMAELKGIPFQEIGQAIFANAQRVFHFSS